MPNPNLSSGQVLPGFWGYVDYNINGGGQEPTRRVLLWGFHGAVAQWTPNVPRLPASQQEVDDGAGRGSDLANFYAAAASQPESQGAEVWCLPITAPAGGVAAIYTPKVLGTPTKSGTVQMWIGSREIPAVGFSTSDTATTIGAALRDAINSVLDLPLGTVTASAGALSIPYEHKGQTGEDLPIRCNVYPAASGITVSAAQMDFAAAAVGAGSVKVDIGAQSVSTTLAGGESATAAAAAVVTQFNSETYPVIAAVDAGDNTIAHLLFTNDKDVRRVAASVISSTGLTVNLGSGATDGTGSAASFSYNGTLGTGAPSISSALTNLAQAGSFRAWAAPWLDTATLGAMATAIEAMSDGSISGQKQQTLTVCDFRAASVAGAVLTGTSPNLTTTAPHYAMCWSPDAPVKGMEVAARVAAARASKWLDAPQFNWNGFQVRGSSRAQILLPWYTPSESAQNTALRTYALAPVVKGSSGFLEVVKGRTTSLAADRRLWSWSCEAQAAYHAVDLGLYFRDLFAGGSIVRYSEPKAANIFDNLSFSSATKARMRTWEENGNYDGADALAPAVKASYNQLNPNRIDVEFPESPVLDLDQVVFTGNFSQPSI